MFFFIKGIGCLLLALGIFSVFSMKAPKGDQAMNGLAGAAVASFLVEALFKYIGGDLVRIAFLGDLGAAAGSMGGVAAAALVPLCMGADPVFAVVAGVAASGSGILPGFLAGYAAYFLSALIKRYIPSGVDTIVGTLALAVCSRGITLITAPFVTAVIGTIGDSITIAAEQSPLVMGFVLGGIMKMVCTSPLSSMALTAMLNLTGLPMGIASIACFGGSFSNGMVFHNLRIGNGGQALAVMLEPLTQADLVTKNAIPMYSCNFFAGGLSGIVAASLGIISNAPGTASPIPGMLVPFAFNDPIKVVIALALSAVCGTLCGSIGSLFYLKTPVGRTIRRKTCMA